MFVDASAIVAILLREDDWMSLAGRMEAEERIYVSPLVLWEATVALSREKRMPFDGARSFIDAFISNSKAETLDITAAVGALAIEASRRYGRGRHKAGLNFGDCFAYACAKAHDLPLLFKGEDFIHTDIKAA